MKINYFAYGSNMDKEQMRERIGSFSKRVGGRLSGHRLEFNKVAQACRFKGYANIVLDADGLVEGALYEIDPVSLAKLDKCEGYPEGYLKIAVKVLVSAQEICAITYLANPTKIKSGLKPDKAYLGHLLRGEDILSTDYFERLKQVGTFD